MDERKLKGSVPKGYLNYIKRKWGITGEQDAMKYAGIQEIPKDADWFPVEKSDRLLEWIAKNKGGEKVVEAGKYVAKDLGVFKYLFASLIGMESVLKRYSTNYRAIFNFGEMMMEKRDGGYWVLLKGARVTEYSCPAWNGALEGFMEITKTKGVLESLESGPEDCEFIIST